MRICFNLFALLIHKYYSLCTCTCFPCIIRIAKNVHASTKIMLILCFAMQQKRQIISAQMRVYANKFMNNFFFYTNSLESAIFAKCAYCCDSHASYISVCVRLNYSRKFLGEITTHYLSELIFWQKCFQFKIPNTTRGKKKSNFWQNWKNLFQKFGRFLLKSRKSEKVYFSNNNIADLNRFSSLASRLIPSCPSPCQMSCPRARFAVVYIKRPQKTTRNLKIFEKITPLVI